MPANTGTAPKVDRCDIQFRNGQTARDVDPSKYRWSMGDRRYPSDYGYDIVRWQLRP